MVEEAVSGEFFLLRKTAEEYCSKGYEVSIRTPLDFMPDYLADLVVWKDHEVKVIEVKSRASLAASPRIMELARIIDSKPGWNFELILVAEPEKLDSPVGAQALERENILTRVAEAERLLESGHSEAAFLLAWSACEAATRLMVAEQGISFTGITSPGYVLDQAAFLGIMSRAEYNHLRDLQKYRNAIVHGFSHGAFNDELVRELSETVRRLVATN